MLPSHPRLCTGTNVDWRHQSLQSAFKTPFPLLLVLYCSFKARLFRVAQSDRIVYNRANQEQETALLTQVALGSLGNQLNQQNPAGSTPKKETLNQRPRARRRVRDFRSDRFVTCY
ncbi:hypothetical protein Pla52n_31300 [Stieleria varia]|uniref:Uncharacterized protein n=1 Tax=Stieleria varia TaxID=2528005 RepID=A0A5C6B3K7_9BACT|nr:hypothetical protein Pla52n_31300 [Stieleria varia]